MAVVASDGVVGAVRGLEFVLVEHDELCGGPRLAGLPKVAPHFVVGFKVAPSDEIIAGGFRGDFLLHGNTGLDLGFRKFWGGKAAGSQQGAEAGEETFHFSGFAEG